MRRYLKKGQHGYNFRREPEEGYDEVSEEPNGDPLAYVAYKNGVMDQLLDGGVFAFETLEQAMSASDFLGKPVFVPLYKAKEQPCTQICI